jgi:dinuclear metal center YbgI/SA1388 family protein
MKCKELLHYLESLYPPSFAEDWDNVGLLVGDEEKEISRVFLALDVTDETLAAASAFGADLMITHHPMIFGGIKQVNAGNYLGRRIIKMIKEDISCYAMHTNFDICGMADLSADCLQLSHTEVLDVTFDDGERKEGIGRVGILPRPMTLKVCAAFVKEALKLNHVTVYGDLEQEICRAAISTGSGKSMVAQAISRGAQVLITGDIDYHTGIDAPAKGIAVIDAGHYGTEYIFIDNIRQVLGKKFPGLQVEGMPVKEPFAWL